ncbi:hypothetical protein [Kamptonema sp. UHCC 0994]|nr:hypothetical protein [Kamptonema sp. UHCC 0994]MDF0554941.1 hypothetical protein [Kamptonema sp. UHCC 0994]
MSYTGLTQRRPLAVKNRPEGGVTEISYNYFAGFYNIAIATLNLIS